VGYTRHDIDTWAALVARSIVPRAAPRRYGAIAYGYGLFTGGSAHTTARSSWVARWCRCRGQTQRQVQLICDFRPDIIMVTRPTCCPSSRSSCAGVDPAASSLRTGIFGAEPGPKRCGELESRADFRPWTSTACREVMGPGWRASDREQGWAVVWEDHFYPEIVDPATGEVLPGGAPGELVLTSLTRKPAGDPLRTHDLTSLLPPTGARCAVWRESPAFDDMLIIGA